MRHKNTCWSGVRSTYISLFNAKCDWPVSIKLRNLTPREKQAHRLGQVFSVGWKTWTHKHADTIRSSFRTMDKIMVEKTDVAAQNPLQFTLMLVHSNTYTTQWFWQKISPYNPQWLWNTISSILLTDVSTVAQLLEALWYLQVGMSWIRFPRGSLRFFIT